MQIEKARCHCGNIAADIELTQELTQYTPRACDCSFCSKHGAAYMSDPNGTLRLTIKNPDSVSIYQQGDELVDLYICKTCGVLVAVTFDDNGNLIGGINSKALDNWTALPPAVPASPKLLSPEEKKERWRQIWFSNVTIAHDDS